MIFEENHSRRASKILAALSHEAFCVSKSEVGQVAKISHAQLSFTFVPKMNEAGFTLADCESVGAAFSRPQKKPYLRTLPF
jgi:hypothetical protein